MQELTEMRNLVESRVTEYLLKNSERIREDAVREGKEERPATGDKLPDRQQMQIQSGFQQIQDDLQIPFMNFKSKLQKRLEERLVARSKPEPEPVYSQFLHLVLQCCFARFPVLAFVMGFFQADTEESEGDKDRRHKYAE